MTQFDTEETVIAAQPPAPHFDDEATLISAQPVVPIAIAKANEPLRIVQRALPFILIAGLFGLFVGVGVGFYATRRIAAEPAIQGNGMAKTKEDQAASEPQELANETESEQASTSANVSAGSSEDNKSDSDASNVSVPMASAKMSAQSRHSRRSFVRTNGSIASERRRNARRGASHIQEIFAGSDPQ